VAETGKYHPSSGNRVKGRQNLDARKAVLVTLLVLKWREAIFRPRSSKPSVRSFYLWPFLRKPRPSGVSLESPGLKNIPQVPENWAKCDQNHDARKPVAVFKWSGAILRSRSWQPSVPSFYLCPFLCKPSPSGVSLESPGLEIIPQGPGNRSKDSESRPARRTVSASFSHS